MTAKAELFMHGRSQAVRLPEEFRFEGTEVRVSKVGDKVIFEPPENPVRCSGLAREPREIPGHPVHGGWPGSGHHCRR